MDIMGNMGYEKYSKYGRYGQYGKYGKYVDKADSQRITRRPEITACDSVLDEDPSGH